MSNESNSKGEFFNFPYLAAFVSLKKNRFISKANFSDGLEIDSISFPFMRECFEISSSASLRLYPSISAHRLKHSGCFRNHASISCTIKNTCFFFSSGIIMVISGCSELINLSNHKCFVLAGESESTKSSIGEFPSTNCFAALRYPAPINIVISMSSRFNILLKNLCSDWRNDSTLLAVSADTLSV